MGQRKGLAWGPLLWLAGHEEGQVALPPYRGQSSCLFLESNPEHVWICSVAAMWGLWRGAFLGSRLGAVLCGSQGIWDTEGAGTWETSCFFPDQTGPPILGFDSSRAPFPFSQPSTPSWPRFLTSLLWSIPWNSGLMESVRNTVLGLF